MWKLHLNTAPKNIRTQVPLTRMKMLPTNFMLLHSKAVSKPTDKVTF